MSTIFLTRLWRVRKIIAFEMITNTFGVTPPPPPHAARADGNHDVQIYNTLPEGKLVDETHLLPPRPPCKKAVSSYMGPSRVQVCRVVLVGWRACFCPPHVGPSTALCEGLRHTELPVPKGADDTYSLRTPEPCCAPSLAPPSLSRASMEYPAGCESRRRRKRLRAQGVQSG